MSENSSVLSVQEEEAGDVPRSRLLLFPVLHVTQTDTARTMLP